jgi:NAD(P)-dependent dehydrogenase (short-subunit alcohol dehydrogenase family)
MSKTVVITGANRGIGFSMAELCVEQGDTVYALCRSRSNALTQLSSAINLHIIEQVDVSTTQGIAQAVKGLSGVSIDLLINNAGILRNESLQDLNVETITEQFTVNALAPLVMTHALLPNLRSGSKLALITSRMGSIEDNTSGGRYGYRMSKAALNIAAMSLAQDLKSDNISVGIYHPGYVQTDMVNHGGDISSEVAAKRLIALMNGLSLAETGVFKHSNGEILPW